MAKDYASAIGGGGALTSLHCTICRYRNHDMTTKAFFGADPQGAAALGGRKQDEAFRLRIWKSFRKHYREIHPELIPVVNRSLKKSGLKI